MFATPRQPRLHQSIGVVLLLILAACGGNDEPAVEVPPPPPPTALPATLAVAAPATRQALNTDVGFGSNVVDPERKLSYRWDFGDGSSSALASPLHRYGKAGTFSVSLAVSNEAGSVVRSSASLTVADLAIVQGRACSAADQGGWCWQNPLPQGNPINDYFWLDGQRGWAVGGSGTVLATTDGGSTWTAQVTGTQAKLLKVTFLNERVGWVGGSNGLLLRTQDGGQHWDSASVGADIDMRRLRAASATTAWVTINDSSHLTIDGGTTWRRIAGPANGGYGLLQTSVTTLWAYANVNGVNVVVRSQDAGASWQAQPLVPLAAGLTRSFSGLGFASEQHGLVQIYDSGYDSVAQAYVSRSSTLLSADGGATWRAVSPPPGLPYWASPNYVQAADGTLFERGLGSGGLSYTTDAGLSWRTISLPTASTIYVIDFVAYSSTRVMLLGGDGRNLLSSDAGVTWREIRGGYTFASAVNSLWFFNAREGLALSDDGNSLHTSDGGQTWVPRQTEVRCCFGWRRLQFAPGTSTGWAIADSGQIYRSSDRGSTWLAPVPQTSALLGSVLDYHFVDETRGWALSETYSQDPRRLFTSVDGGLSWQPVPDSSALAGMQALRFADRTHGVAVGVAGVALLSSDGGATWRPRPTGSDRPLRRLAFVDAQTVVAVGDGGTILRSSDRGQNWSRMPSPSAQNLNEVRFVSATVGYAAGVAGTVISTRDAGLSWQDASPTTELELRGAFFIDDNTGWAVGGNGAILATISGGR